MNMNEVEKKIQQKKKQKGKEDMKEEGRRRASEWTMLSWLRERLNQRWKEEGVREEKNKNNGQGTPLVQKKKEKHQILFTLHPSHPLWTHKSSQLDSWKLERPRNLSLRITHCLQVRQLRVDKVSALHSPSPFLFLSLPFSFAFIPLLLTQSCCAHSQEPPWPPGPISLPRLLQPPLQR